MSSPSAVSFSHYDRCPLDTNKDGVSGSIIIFPFLYDSIRFSILHETKKVNV